MSSRASRALRFIICNSLRSPLVRKFHSQRIENLAVQDGNKDVESTSSPRVDFPKHFINRNPRSLEFLGVAPKPKGFETSRRRVDYYYRLVLDVSTRHVSAYVEHNSGVRVMEASTKEFGIARHLHKTCNVSAAHNIGRVLGHRLSQVGLVRVMWEDQYRTRKHQKVVAFLKGIKEASIVLNEPRVKKTLPSELPSHRTKQREQAL